MNQGQTQFYNFIMDRVKEGSKEDANELLSENFKKQDIGSFTKEDITLFASRIITFIKPECIEEVQSVMANFSNSSTH